MKYCLYALLSASILCITSCTVNDYGEFETTWLFWVLLAALVFGMIVGLIQNKKEKEASQKRGEDLEKATEEFHVSAKVVGVNNHYQFIVDDVDKNIIFMESTGEKKFVSFEKIMSVEMIEDNSVISSKSLGRTLGGALLGDLVAGGAGMVVGGLSGNSKQKKKVSKVEVVIKMRDFSDTALHIPCFIAVRETNHTNKEIKADDIVYGPMYKKGVEDAIKITELVGIIIDQMENSPAQPSVTAPVVTPLSAEEMQNTSTSIADELLKLAKLKEQGLISPEEFETLKSKIIK